VPKAPRFRMGSSNNRRLRAQASSPFPRQSRREKGRRHNFLLCAESRAAAVLRRAHCRRAAGPSRRLPIRRKTWPFPRDARPRIGNRDARAPARDGDQDRHPRRAPELPMDSCSTARPGSSATGSGPHAYDRKTGEHACSLLSNVRASPPVLPSKPSTKETSMTTRTFGLFASVTLAAMTGFPARQAFAANDNGGPPGPPQEAIDACANQKEGATCTVSFQGQSVQGKCVKGPEGQEPLACMPPPPRPPQEAIAACANQSEGATCSLTFHGRTVEGTCGKGPDGNETLACMPPPPPEAVKACANLSEGATCTVSHHGRDMEGKCRLSPSGKGTLACAPPHPPRH
jgi:hypothetical protein